MNGFLNLTEGNLTKNFLRYAIPVVLSGVLTQAFSLIDSALVGRLLGDAGLAAIGSTHSFVTVVHAFLWGFALGIGAYISMLFGGKRYRETVNSIRVNLLILTVVSAVLITAMLIFCKPIFALLRIGEDIYRSSMTYYIITTIGLVFFNINWFSVSVFNGMGATSYPLKVSVLSGAINVVSKYVLIGLLDMGITAAAVTTTVSSAIGSVCYLLRFRRDFKILAPEQTELDFDFSRIAPAWCQGFPCMIQQMIMYIAPFAIQPLINEMGAPEISAFSICNKIYVLCATIFQQSSKTLTTFCSQSVGNGKIDGIKKGVLVGFRQSFLLALPIIAFCYFCPKTVVSLFYNDIGSESARYVMRYLFLCMPFVVCQVVNNMFHSFYRGVLFPVIATISTASYSVARMVATFLLIGSLRMDGIFWGFNIAWMFEMILLFSFYRSGIWLRRLERLTAKA